MVERDVANVTMRVQFPPGAYLSLFIIFHKITKKHINYKHFNLSWLRILRIL